MSLFDTGLPSVRQIQGFIKNKQPVEIGVITSQVFQGKILWQDHNCICIIDSQQQKNLVWMQGIIYIKPETSQ